MQRQSTQRAINAEAINADAISAEAISAETDAISAGVLELRHGVEGPVMEQGMLSHSWCTPKESNGSAQNSSVNALTGLQPACALAISAVTMDWQCSTIHPMWLTSM